MHGMVVYPDGQPLTRGTVEFELVTDKDHITATGEINPDGTFQLGTFEEADGAVIGSHRAAVIADFDIGTEEERPELLPPAILDPKFSDLDTSGLKFEIEAKTNRILVEVDYAPPEEKKPTTGEEEGEEVTGALVATRQNKKRAQDDAKLLANRIALLKLEEKKAWKKIQETKKKAE